MIVKTCTTKRKKWPEEGLGSRFTEFPIRTPDSDSLAFPTPDSRLFHPKKPTVSRLLRCNKFSNPKYLINRNSVLGVGSRSFFTDSQLPTPYSLPQKIHRLSTPNSQALARSVFWIIQLWIFYLFIAVVNSLRSSFYYKYPFFFYFENNLAQKLQIVYVWDHVGHSFCPKKLTFCI